MASTKLDIDYPSLWQNCYYFVTNIIINNNIISKLCQISILCCINSQQLPKYFHSNSLIYFPI